MGKELVELLNFANSFADLSGKILKKNFLKKITIDEKKDGSLVTNIDKEIEHKFRTKLKKKFKNHGVIGEEFGEENLDKEFVWVIDPLDGTHSFISGKPLFGTLICCLKKNQPVLGVIDIPILDKRWHGASGFGVKLNTKKCKRESSSKQINELIVSSTSFFMFNEIQQKKIKEIYDKTRFPVFGNDCYSYGLLLSNKIDLIIEATMKPWDYLAQVALINEFGGVITDWNGKKLDLKSDGKVIASIDSNHHKNILKHLN